MKRQKRAIGSILQIDLKDDTHSYAIVLDKASIAVFNIKTKEDVSILNILNKEVLFIVAVYNSAITSGRWKKIGTTIPDNRFTNLPLKFIQDSINPQIFEIYNPNTGLTTPATKEQCLNLECAAVWEAEHVESRILDNFNGQENIWLRQLQIK
jgi:hypothetical protein